MLAPVPIALPDPIYSTPVNTALTVTSSNHVLLNDVSLEGSALSAIKVSDPAHGVVGSWSSSGGTFVYTPDTSYTGVDKFTYKVSADGQDSAPVSISIAVGGHTGARTNLDENALDDALFAGSLEWIQPLALDTQLVYNSLTIPRPIVVVETSLLATSAVPTSMKAKLTVNGSTLTDYTYTTTGLTAGSPLRFALQADAGLATGRYPWTMTISCVFDSGTVSRDYTGYVLVESRTASPFGAGFWLHDLDRIVTGTGGVQLVLGDGTSLWFPDNGTGGYLPAEGDQTFSTLVKNGDNTFTRTFSTGEKTQFNTSGLQTSRVTAAGLATTYTYTNGVPTQISDAFSRNTTLTYTSGLLSGVTDIASKSASLSYSSGKLSSVTQPDPDGGGSLTAPVTSFAYDGTTSLLTSATLPDPDGAGSLTSPVITYTHTNHRLATISHSGGGSITLTPMQRVGLPTGTSGNSLTAPSAAKSTLVDERSKTWEFKFDRFGNLTSHKDPLANVSLIERNHVGQPFRLTGADPDGGGSQTAPVTKFGYNSSGDNIKTYLPDGATRSMTFNTTHRRRLTETDEVGRVWTFTYDSNGNRLTDVDPGNNTWTWVYNSSGNPTSLTTPDPDGAGGQSAYVTTFSYDSYQRPITITFPDSSDRELTWDSADNLLTDKNELNQSGTWVYDALNRVTKYTDRVGAEWEFSYDALSRRIKTLDPYDKATDYEYSARGFLTKEIQPDPDGAGSLSRPEITYAYDSAGNLTQVGLPSYYNGAALTYTYNDAGWRITESGPVTLWTETLTYDNLGRVTKVTTPDPDGAGQLTNKNTTYEYNSRSWVTKLLRDDPDLTGPLTAPYQTFTYNSAGDLTSATDFRGYTTSVQYLSRGLVSDIIEPDPDGSGPGSPPVTTFGYDALGRRTHLTDPILRLTTWAYNNRDWVTSITRPDPDGAGSLTAPVTSFGYDVAGRNTSVTDPLSRVTSVAFDHEGRVTSVTQPDPDGGGSQTSPVTSYAYNLAGSLTSVTDPKSFVTSIAYDHLQRRTSVTQPDPDGGGSLTAPVWSFEYNSRGLLSKTIDPLSRYVTYQYDDPGRRTGETDYQNNVTNYAFDTYSQVTSVTGPDPDGAGSLTRPVTSYGYDYYRRLKSITDPLSGLTSFSYDVADNLLTLSDPELNETVWAYDGLGRPTIETNELDKSRSFYYDHAGNLTRRVDRNGRVTQFIQDNLDRITAEKWQQNATPVPSVSVSTTTEGGLGISEVQRVGMTISGSGMSGTFTLTFSGQTTGTIAWNASAATVDTALENLSNIGAGDVSVTKTQDTSTAQVWQVTFGGAMANANQAQITINTGGITPMGSLTKVEVTDTQGSGPANEVQVATLNNATGGTFRLAFSGQTTKPIDYNASAATVETALEELNAVDNVTVTGNAGGPWTVTFSGTHASVNVPAMTGDAATALSGSTLRTISYTWDSADQLTAASDPDSAYAYSYDNLGRVLTVDNNNTPGVPRVILTSAYDANSNRTSLSATNAGTNDFLNSYTFDNLNRLTRLDQTGNGGATVAEKRVDFAYNALGQFTTIARYKDTDGGSTHEVATANYTYDTLNRLTGLSYKKGGNNLFTPYAWTYDGLSRVTQLTSQDGTSAYTYDATSQLTAVDHSFQTDESYSFDDNGNRTMSGYTTGTNNRLTSDGVYNYTYDDEGNRTKRTAISGGAYEDYEWDYRNRLTKVTFKTSGGTTTKVVAYTYDLFDRRIGRAVDTTSAFDLADAAIERYVYFADDVVFDFEDPDGNGSTAIAIKRRYLHGPAVDQVLAQEATATGVVHWQLADDLGTVRDLVDSTGSFVTHFKFEAFGKVTAGDTSKTRYLFTGREYDVDTGYQYNRLRWYDSRVGRWLSEDPIGFGAGDPNNSRYVANRPTYYTDSSGMQGQAPFDYPTDEIPDWFYDAGSQDYQNWYSSFMGVTIPKHPSTFPVGDPTLITAQSVQLDPGTQGAAPCNPTAIAAQSIQLDPGNQGAAAGNPTGIAAQTQLADPLNMPPPNTIPITVGQPGGYPLSGYNPGNWWRWLYTGDPNAPDVVYDAARGQAGEDLGNPGINVSGSINIGADRSTVSLTGGFQAIWFWGEGPVLYQYGGGGIGSGGAGVQINGGPFVAYNIDELDDYEAEFGEANVSYVGPGFWGAYGNYARGPDDPTGADVPSSIGWGVAAGTPGGGLNADVTYYDIAGDYRFNPATPAGTNAMDEVSDKSRRTVGR